jgi:hypothetical protein
MAVHEVHQWKFKKVKGTKIPQLEYWLPYYVDDNNYLGSSISSRLANTYHGYTRVIKKYDFDSTTDTYYFQTKRGTVFIARMNKRYDNEKYGIQSQTDIAKILKDNNMEKNGNLKKTPFSSHTVSSHTATSLHILSKEQLIAIILGKEK